MTDALLIAAILIFLLFILIGFVLFKEVRTHIFWRRLVAEGDFEAINGILIGEINRWAYATAAQRHERRGLGWCARDGATRRQRSVRTGEYHRRSGVPRR